MPRPRARTALIALCGCWIAIGLTFAAILGIELVLRLAFAAKDAIAPLPLPDPRVVAQGYDNATWVPTLYAEQEQLRAEWAPDVGFRLQPFQGELITINARSERATPAPATAAGPSVLVLGGSSAWGLGARDESTLPSLLQQELARGGRPALLINAAQIGHVQAQELAELVLRLRTGHRPRVVVFHDGVNDVLAALQSGQAGGPQNAANRAREFNLLARPGDMARHAITGFAQTSALARLADSSARRLGWTRNGDAPGRAAPFSLELARAVVAACASNMRQIDALARAYDFHALCCWQPVLFTKRQKTAYEIEKAQQYAWLDAPLASTRANLATLSSAATERVRFLDLTGLLDDEPSLIYVDFCHTTERPNHVIARAIATALADWLEPSPPTNLSDGTPEPVGL